MPSYRLREEEGKETVVVKSGFDHEFVMSSYVSERQKALDYIKAREGTCETKQAEMDNFTSHHPVIETLTPVQMVAVTLYTNARAEWQKADKELSSMKELLAEMEGDIAEVEKQTGKTFDELVGTRPNEPMPEEVAEAIDAAMEE